MFDILLVFGGFHAMRKAASIVLASLALTIGTTPACAGLLGTTLSLSAQQQLTPTSKLFTTSFTRSALVSADEVEFPDVNSLFDPNDPRPPGFGSLVNTSIDAGNDFITIDFDDAGSGRFASGFENSYVFTFASTALATITGAAIDQSVTTLGLAGSDLRFTGNRLFVNVEGLSFNPSSYVRIDLDVVGGPTGAVPEPASWALMITGFGVVGARLRRRPRRPASVPTTAPA